MRVEERAEALIAGPHGAYGKLRRPPRSFQGAGRLATLRRAAPGTMKESFTLSSEAVPGVRLRTIEARDGEPLRLWKNANRASFFFRDTIEPEGQRRWYEGYRERPRDFMFVVEAGGAAIGCMGFRVLDSESDVYNVIRGAAGGPPGAMSGALRL